MKMEASVGDAFQTPTGERMVYAGMQFMVRSITFQLAMLMAVGIL
jgi:hypothetical protein